MEKKPTWLVYVMLAIATSTWGSAFIAGKFAVESSVDGDYTYECIC